MCFQFNRKAVEAGHRVFSIDLAKLINLASFLGPRANRAAEQHESEAGQGRNLRTATSLDDFRKHADFPWRGQRRTATVVLSIGRICGKEGSIMGLLKRILRNVLPIFVLVLTSISAPAQDPASLQHFDYDQKAPLGIKQIGIERRAHATVYDLTYDSPKGGVVPAYLVVPKGRGPFAAIIWGHWCWQNSSMRNRKEFLDEALLLAQSGVVSLLPDAPLARPGYVASKDPLDERNATDFLQQAMDARRGVDVLFARRDVDRRRLAYVGHSCGAAVGALLSGVDRRFKAFVLMAGTTSDEVSHSTKEFQEFRQKVGPEKLDALIAKYSYLDQGVYVSHAAPAVVFLQYGSREKFLNAERAQLYAAVVSEPKQLKIYDAEHNLNAEARRDRIHFLTEQLKLKPLSDAAIAAIPNLYQPPNPN
jgi:dienelactone hydrolase